MTWIVLALLAAVQVPAHFNMPFNAQTPAEAASWQDAVRSRLLEIVQVQHPRQDRPLDVRVEPFTQKDGMRTASLSFMGNDGERVECRLTAPEGVEPKPAVLCLHGHGGDRDAVYDNKTIYKGFAGEYARRGFVTLAPTLKHCEFAPNQLWNLMRLVDVLEGLPQVDPTRIGVAGLSMGGEWSMWLAACDKRIRGAVVSGWMCATEGVLRVPNCPCWMPPGLLELCDIAEVHILIAPRPLLIESAIGDECFPIDATDAGFKKIVRGYDVMGAHDKVLRDTFPGGHAWRGDRAYTFMEDALSDKK